MLSSDAVRCLLRRGVVLPKPTVDRLDFIEGNVFDLSFETLLVNRRPRTPPFIGATERHIPGYVEVPPVKCDEVPGLHWVLKGPRTYQAQSLETVNLPEGVQGLMIPRTSLFRTGLLANMGMIAWGFTGKITIAIYCPAYVIVRVGVGARLASVAFFGLHGGGGDKYEGIWTGDKTGTNGMERAW